MGNPLRNGSGPSTPGEVVEEFSLLLRDAHRAMGRVIQDRLAAAGVNMGHWYFLLALWKEDGLTQRELSQRVGMMEPTTVTALNGMERRGLVERIRNIQDRRKVNVHLTPKGRALKDELFPIAASVTDQAVQGIALDDISLARQVLQRIIGNLERHEATSGKMREVLEEALT